MSFYAFLSLFLLCNLEDKVIDDRAMMNWGFGKLSIRLFICIAYPREKYIMLPLNKNSVTEYVNSTFYERDSFLESNSLTEMNVALI
jgi:hypothetical protein